MLQSFLVLLRRLRRSPSVARRYGLAAILGAFALVIGVVVPTQANLKIGLTLGELALVTLSAWFGGLGPGLVCTAFCTASAAWWVEPAGSIRVGDPAEMVAIAMFAVVGAVVSLLCGELHRARRARDELIAIVSHDLRSLLGAVELSAGLIGRLAAPGSEGDTLRRCAATQKRAVASMSAMIRDLFDASVLDLGGVPIVPARQDARELVVETAETFEPEALAKEVRLEHELPDVPLAVFADRARVLQVLSNLTQNALRFTPPGGRVTLRVEQTDHDVVFRVTDTGCGIPPDERPRVFDRFKHAPSEAGGGSGLGLYVARSIIEAHGGVIRAEGALGGGSTFRFTLPGV